jgi:hypothetical protein
MKKCHKCKDKLHENRVIHLGHRKICIKCYNKRKKHKHKTHHFRWVNRIEHETPVIFASLALISAFFIPIGGLIFGLLEFIKRGKNIYVNIVAWIAIIISIYNIAN